MSILHVLDDFKEGRRIIHDLFRDIIDDFLVQFSLDARMAGEHVKCPGKRLRCRIATGNDKVKHDVAQFVVAEWIALVVVGVHKTREEILELLTASDFFATLLNDSACEGIYDVEMVAHAWFPGHYQFQELVT